MDLISTFSVGATQTDGRFYVKEQHVADDGRVFPYEYLTDGSIDPQMIMEERAIVVRAALAQRAAAREFVVGAEVPRTKHEFLSLFTSTERIAIRQRAKVNEMVLDFMEMLSASGGVYKTLAYPGLQYLQALGDLKPGRADEIARAM
ncbi:hypothetical protein ACHAC9_22290 [Massilia sp. CMS3.1]|uniref:hypothetical protein n=1 Tax=Massilia sp. CMS3.1 TaxID=3373083 RepID=UPI003EE71FCF